MSEDMPCILASGVTTVYHMDKANNENIGHRLGEFINEFGIPKHLTFDGASIQVGSKTIFQNHVIKHEIQNQRLSSIRSNEKPSEGSIRDVKRKWYQM